MDQHTAWADAEHGGSEPQLQQGKPGMAAPACRPSCRQVRTNWALKSGAENHLQRGRQPAQRCSKALDEGERQGHRQRLAPAAGRHHYRCTWMASKNG